MPRVNFGREPTGVEDIAPSEIIAKGLELGYINQQQYYEVLKQIGVKISESLQEEPKKQGKPKENGETEEEPEEEPHSKMEKKGSDKLIVLMKG
jgi:hypothetical protein